TATRNFVNEGEFVPKVVANAAPVRSLSASPVLLGYIGTTAKATASTWLRVGDEDDPLLASWRIGLGKSTAWTSDAAERWSKGWATWNGYVGFWSAVVKDSFPSAVGGAVRAEVNADTLRVTAESAAPWPDGATADAHIAAPDGSDETVRLTRVSPT